MNETYTLKEIEEKLEHEKYLRKENQELYEEIKVLKHQRDFFEIEYKIKQTKISKARVYIEELDCLEDKIDDYAISKYVKKDLLDILRGEDNE